MAAHAAKRHAGVSARAPGSLGLRPPSPGARPDTPAQDTLTADETSATMSGTTDDMLPGIPDGSVPFQHHVLFGQRNRLRPSP